VRIGDFFVCRSNLTKLIGKKVCGRPLDDRVGCATVLKIAEHFSKNAPKNDVYYVFSVQEEVGCRGAKTAAFGIECDYALVFDVTGTGDTPSAKPMACKVSDGAAIKVKDSSVICHRDVVRELTVLAKENKIKHQIEILTYGGTDTSSIQMTGMGAKVGALSIPTRYIHSGVEMLDLADAEACAALAIKFTQKV
jgi:endoglucanase